MKRTERDGLGEKLTDLDWFDRVYCFSDPTHDCYLASIQIRRNSLLFTRFGREEEEERYLSSRAFLEIGLYIISNYRFTTTSGQTGLITKDSLISYHQYFILVINLLFNFEKCYWTTVTEDQTLYYIKKIIAFLSKFFFTLVLLFNWRQNKRSIIVKISTKI